jgi:hypothetical protein
MHIPAGRTQRARLSHARRRTSGGRLIVPKIELIIVSIGLVAAVVAGVVAYQVVGPYGDGPLSIGYRRIKDPETGKSLLVHESRTSTGVLRRVIDGQTLTELQFDLHADGKREQARVHVKGAEVTRVDRDRDGDGRSDVWEYYDAEKRLVKAGFSVAGDGIVDAWAYRDEKGQVRKIEVSTRRDGSIDRWEHYEKGQLARVEQDTDRNGRVDRWSTYDAGILIGTVVDADGDGRPDDPGSKFD